MVWGKLHDDDVSAATPYPHGATTTMAFFGGTNYDKAT